MVDKGSQYDDENEGFYRGRDSVGNSTVDSEADAYDEQFGDTGSSKKSEADTSAPTSQSESESLDQQADKQRSLAQDEANDIGFTYKNDSAAGTTYRQRLKMQRSNWKKYAAGGGIAASVGGIIISAFLALIPLKFEFITNFIQDQVSTVPQYAIERRVDYLLSRYINRSVLGANAGDQIYTSNTLAGTLYGNWKSANFELKLKDEFGLEFKALDGGETGNTTRWQVLHNGNPVSYDGSTDGIGDGDFEIRRGQMRQVIREVTKESTQWNQFLKRRTMRRILQNKYNVPTWFVDVFGQRSSDKADDIRESYIQKKVGFYKWSIDNTFGRVSKRYGAYLNCIIDRDACADLNKERGTFNDPEGSDVSEVTDGVDFDPTEEDANKRLTQLLRRFGIRKILGSAIAGLGVVDLFSSIVDGVEDGRITQMQYAMNTDAAVGAATWVNVAKDQLNDGSNILSEDSQLLFERFAEFEKSPVYAAAAGQLDGFGYNGLGQTSGAQSIQRDCVEGGEVVSVSLSPGQVVCDNMLFYDPLFEDRVQAIQGWDTLVEINEAYKATIGRVFDLLNALVERIPYLEEASQAILEATRLDDLMGAGMDKIADYVFNPGCVGAEIDEFAFECYYAGMEGITNELAVSGGEYGIGGRALTEIEVVAIYDEVEQDRKNEFQQKSFFARLFDTNDYDSLLGRVAMATPSDSGQIANNITTAVSNPFQTIASSITSPVSAQANRPANFNPFGVIRYGYPTNSEAFEADWESLESCTNQLTDQRDEPEQIDGIVFPVHTTTDPCALERVTTNVLGCLFSNVDDCGVDPVNQFEVDSTLPVTAEYREVVCNQPSIAVTPSSDLSGLVASNNAGTCFELAAGTYRINNIQPKDDMTFVGAGPELTILDGNGYDVAFHGAGNNVTVSSMTLKDYNDLGPGGAFPQPQAPIRTSINLWGENAGEGWLVDNVYSYGNVASGVAMGSGWTVQRGKFYDNGVTGISGTRIVGGAVLGNEVYGNGADGAPGAGVNAAGMKFTVSGTPEAPLIVQDNEVYENDKGIGIWCDIACLGFHVINNYVHDEAARGIFYEISSGALISGNRLENIGTYNPDFTRDWEPGAIGLGESSDSIIEGNTISDSKAGVVITQTRRPAPGEDWLQRNIDENTWGDDLTLVIGNTQVVGNRLTNTGGMGVAVGSSASGIEVDHSSIQFRDNTYDNPGGMNFGIAGRNSSYAEWQANGWQ